MRDKLHQRISDLDQSFADKRAYHLEISLMFANGFKTLFQDIYKNQKFLKRKVKLIIKIVLNKELYKSDESLEINNL